MSMKQYRSAVFFACLVSSLLLNNAARIALNAASEGNATATKTRSANGEGTVVIDLGSYQIKASVLADELTQPPTTLRTTIQKSKHKDTVTQQLKSRLGGEEHSMWRTEYPIVKGIVQDWDDLDKILEHLLNNELRIDLSGRDVLVTFSATGAPKAIIEKLVRNLFETYDAERVKIMDQALLSILAAGQMWEDSQLVVNIGEDETYAMTFFEGFSLPHTRTATQLGSKFVTECFNRRLFYPATSQSNIVMSREVKESAHTFAAVDYDAAQTDFRDMSPKPVYSKPDGSSMTLGTELYECPEQLFDPSKFAHEIGNKGPSIVDVAHTAIQESDIDIRRDALQHIVITGGGANIKGLVERFVKELKAKYPDSMPVNALAVQDSLSREHRERMAWNGGALLASVNHGALWLDKEAYEENGAEHIFTLGDVY